MGTGISFCFFFPVGHFFAGCHATGTSLWNINKTGVSMVDRHVVKRRGETWRSVA